MSANELEGSNPNLAGVKVGKSVTSGTATPKLRKASVTPSPSDKGSKDNGKAQRTEDIQQQSPIPETVEITRCHPMLSDETSCSFVVQVNIKAKYNGVTQVSNLRQKGFESLTFLQELLQVVQ